VNKKRRLTLLALPAAALLLLAAGISAASAVQVVSVHPSKSLAQMLPGTTVFFVSADLNPTGQTRDALGSIERAFTDQPGWAAIARQFNDSQRRYSQAQNCYQDTSREADSYLQYLGHDTALALVGTKGITRSALQHASSLTTALQRNLVVVASVNYHATLAQLFFGSPVSQLQKATVYKGTTIYRESFSSCGQIAQSMPQTIYAAIYKGYAVLGLLPGPIERVVDTGAGSAPSLASNRTYGVLMKQLPGNRLGSYYLDGRALRKVGLLNGVNRLPGVPTGVSLSSYGSALQPVAGALSVDAGEVRLVQTAWNPSAAPGKPAGAAASFLPDDVIGLVSLQGFPETIRRISAELKRDGFISGSMNRTLDPTLNDLTSGMAGEADLVMFRPATTPSGQAPAGFDSPLTFMWQLKDQASASNHLDAALKRQQVANQFTTVRASDGTAYHVISGGYGYAVRKGWVVTSLAIASSLDALSSNSGPRLASVPGFRSAVLAGSVPGSIWYINVSQLRRTLEAAFLPMASHQEASQYRSQVASLVAPLQTISGSAGTSSDRRVAISVLTVRVGPAS